MAFGCLFYEMLTGRRAFGGETVSDTLVAVLTAEVDLDALPTAVPRAVRRLLRRCLEREPKKRLRDIADGLLILDEDLDDGAPAPVMVPPRVAPADGRCRGWQPSPSQPSPASPCGVCDRHPLRSAAMRSR